MGFFSLRKKKSERASHKSIASGSKLKDDEGEKYDEILDRTETETSSVKTMTDSYRSFSNSSPDQDLNQYPTILDEDEIQEHRLASPEKGDPYADVRDRMEALSHRSRMRHAYETTGKKTSNNCENEHSDDLSLVENTSTPNEPVIPFFAAWTTYLGYAVLIAVGHIRDLLACIFRRGRYLAQARRNTYPSDDAETYAPLLSSFENFYTKRLYHRIQDCFNRPVASNPGAKIEMLERVSSDGNKTLKVLRSLDALSADQAEVYKVGKHMSTLDDGRVTRKCLNLGSYNYLGFADDWKLTCKKNVLKSMLDLPVSVGSSRMESGTTKLHDEVETIVAEFIGKESAMVLNMGFNTNATTIPALMGKGDLIMSDELNHTSIINGARTSGAAIRCFGHNDSENLEEILREAIVLGQPRTRRPWRKIMVIVEGIYSMEGEYCSLRSIVKVCKKYGAYIYVDEAHSIGAMGPTGRGICEYTGVDPSDIDILMGTFTKSFGAMGGYIAGSKAVISMLREKCAASAYHNAISPVVCQQIISSFSVIMGRDGTNIGKQKIAALRDNSNYFRMRLHDLNVHVMGHYDSPIMPVMLYNPTKVGAFSRECLKRGLAVVVVGFPAVPILLSRARFCISAGMTRQDLDRALKELDEVVDILKIRYDKTAFG